MYNKFQKNICSSSIVIFDIFALLSILLSIVYGISNYTGIIFGDEFGYWSTAGYLNGYNWNNLLKEISYYSYGYSAVLYLAMRISMFVEINSYQIAIIINALFLIISYFALNKIIKYLALENNNFTIRIISLMCTLYTGNIALAKYNWAESFLYLCYMLSILSLIRLFDSCNIINIIIFSFLLSFTYIVHNRSINIVIIGSIFGIIAIVTSPKFKIINFIFYIAILFLLTYFTNIITNIIKANCFIYSLSDINYEVVSIGERLIKYLTWEGIVNFIYSFIGKFYYILIGSLGIIIFSIRTFLKSAKELLIQKKLTSKNWILLYILFISISALVITTIYLTPENGTSLKDYNGGYYLYGRYNEYIIPLLIALGYIEIIKSNRYILTIYYTITFILLFLVAIITYSRLQYVNIPGGIWNASLVPYLLKNNNNSKTILYAAFIVILISIIILFFVSRKKYKLLPILIIVFWLYSDYNVYSTWLVVKQNSFSELDIAIKNEYNIDNNISILSDNTAIITRLQQKYYNNEMYLEKDINKILDSNADFLIISREIDILEETYCIYKALPYHIIYKTIKQ